MASVFHHITLALSGAGGAIALLAHDPATGEIHQSAAGVVIVAMIVTYMWHVVRENQGKHVIVQLVPLLG